MKVSVNNQNKPAPFWSGAAGGLIGGLLNIFNQGSVNRQQMQHDKDMAAVNQQNTLEQMAVQNDYQVAQWNRENEYNDPSAVAARYRAAGISPHSALGGSASGAGIAGGLSSAPSGSSTGSSSHLNSGALSGLAGALASAEVNSAQADLLRANANKVRSETPPEDQELWYQNWQKMLSGMSVDQSIVMLNSSKKLLNDAEKDERITRSELNLAMAANQQAQEALTNWQIAFNNDNRQNMLNKARSDWELAVQKLEFNNSKNPLILEELRGNIKMQAMNLISAEIANRLAEKNIEVSQAQINNILQQEEKLKAECDKIIAETTTENELRNYKKAESIQRQISGYVDSATDIAATILSRGVSKSGTKTIVYNGKGNVKSQTITESYNSR